MRRTLQKDMEMGAMHAEDRSTVGTTTVTHKNMPKLSARLYYCYFYYAPPSTTI